MLEQPKAAGRFGGAGCICHNAVCCGCMLEGLHAALCWPVFSACCWVVLHSSWPAHANGLHATLLFHSPDCALLLLAAVYVACRLASASARHQPAVKPSAGLQAPRYGCCRAAKPGCIKHCEHRGIHRQPPDRISMFSPTHAPSAHIPSLSLFLFCCCSAAAHTHT